jgi:chromosome segregation ATPase
MSIESRRIIDEGNNNDSMTAYQRNTHFGSAIQYTSSIVVNLRQLQTDLQSQHQHDKDTLNELNQRFQIFIDRIQTLQSQNSKYLLAIAELRRQFTGVSTSDIEQNYSSSRTNFSSIYSTKIDYESDYELFRFQSDIYQRLIEIEQQSKDRRIVKLEEELKQSKSILINTRTSYEQLQKEIENIYADNADLTKQYLALTHEWCSMRKQRKKWDLSMETLKSYVGFYRNLRSNFGL